MKQSRIRCAIYTRQSVATDADFSSCDAQYDACLALIRAHAPERWVPIEERFDDSGVSGATMERPALDRLIHRVEEGQVDRVVVHRLDRLTRSVSDWATLVGAFRRRGTQLSVVVGDIHLGDLAFSDLVLNLLATFAQFEREMIGERLRDARAALRAHGIRNAGRIPFGYSSDPLSHQLVVDRKKADIVHRMFEMAASGATPSAIASWFNAKWDGDRRLLDGRQPWSAKSVLRVLRNEVYLGRLGEVANTHDAVIDPDTFSKVSTIIDERRTRPPGRREKEGDLFLLRKLLRCVRCDRLMTTSSSRALPDPTRPTSKTKKKKKKAKLPPRYYRCRGRNACVGSQVSAEDIELRVLNWLKLPPEGISPEAHAVLTNCTQIWDLLFPENVLSLIAELVWEVQWDGPNDVFTVVLDEITISQLYESLQSSGTS